MSYDMGFEIRVIRHGPEQSSLQYEVYRVTHNKMFRSIDKLATYSSLREAESFIKSIVVYPRLESTLRYNDDGIKLVSDLS